LRRAEACCETVMAFGLTINYVASGLSFRQAIILTHTVTRTGLHKLRGVREEDVARFVRPVAGISLGKIASLLGAMKRGH
jgi:hypothetical protein